MFSFYRGSVLYENDGFIPSLSKAKLLCSQGLCKALQELRAEMVATAEKNIIANAAQKEENLNVQLLVDKQTKDLKVGFP